MAISFRLVRAEEPELEDDDYVVLVDGQETPFRIQCCSIGGGYTVKRDVYEDGEFVGVDHYDHYTSLRSAKADVERRVAEWCGRR